MDPKLFKLRPLAALVAIALCEMSTAHASPTISLAAQYALGAGANATTAHDALGEGSLSPPGVTFPKATGADYYLNVNGSVQSTDGIFFHAYGYTTNPTNFGARASGTDNFYGKTSSLYSTTYTNSGTTAVDLTFSFYVNPGQLALAGIGAGFADLLLQVSRDQTVVSQGDTTITQTANGVSCSENDVGTLGNWASCGSPTAASIDAAGGTFTVDLGLVNGGQTIAIDYDMVATVQGAFLSGSSASSGNCNGGYGGYGGYGYGGYGYGNNNPEPCLYYNAIARSGDPFNGVQQGDPANFSLTARALTAAVPEPGSLALFGVAAGAWWRSVRRKRRLPPA